MKRKATNYRVYFILIVILSGVQGFASAQHSLPYPVILSSRQFHPTSPQDTLSTLRMVDLYHPDRIDWMYCTNAEQLAQLKRRKVPYSLAINPQVPDSLGYTAKGRVVDLDGKKLVAPWMQNWKQKNANWGCVNSPDFKEVFYTQSRKLIDLDAYGLFVDDARFNDHALEWGGCFCDYCMAGFSTYIHAEQVDSLGTNFNYRNYLHGKGISTVVTKGRGQRVPLWNQFQRFQTQSVVRFLKGWRVDMASYAKRPLTFLTNNFGGQWTEIYQVFDVGIAELSEDKINADFIQKQVETAKKLGKQQYFTLPSDDSNKQLKTLFLTYAIGSGLVIPWDVMVSKKLSSQSNRYFGAVKTYMPVYNLFRSGSMNTANLRRGYANQTTAFNITSTNKNDSIKIDQYPEASHQLIKVTNHNNSLNNGIFLVSVSTMSVNNVKVVFPEEYKKSIQGNRLQINYKGDLVVLDVQPE